VRIPGTGDTDLSIELRDPLIEVVELIGVVIERRSRRRELELLRPQPSAMLVRPVGAGSEVSTVTEEEFAELVPRGGPRLAHVVARTEQVARSLLFLRRHVDRSELARAVETQELERVAAVGLDTFARSRRDQRGRDHLACDSLRREHPLKFEPARARLVAGLHAAALRQLREHFLELLRLVWQLAPTGSRPPSATSAIITDRACTSIPTQMIDSFMAGSFALRLWQRLSQIRG
jgi:hypothetical protein